MPKVFNLPSPRTPWRLFSSGDLKTVGFLAECGGAVAFCFREFTGPKTEGCEVVSSGLPLKVACRAIRVLRYGRRRHACGEPPRISRTHRRASGISGRSPDRLFRPLHRCRSRKHTDNECQSSRMPYGRRSAPALSRSRLRLLAAEPATSGSALNRALASPTALAP